jgi:adenylyl- and sulfurtransferase ThiI
MFRKKSKYIIIIIKSDYFKHIAKHTLHFVNFLSNVQLLKTSFQEKYKIILLKIYFYSLFIPMVISRK